MEWVSLNFSPEPLANGMLHHSFGVKVIFSFLQHFFAPALNLMLCLQAGIVEMTFVSSHFLAISACKPDTRDCNDI